MTEQYARGLRWRLTAAALLTTLLTLAVGAHAQKGAWRKLPAVSDKSGGISGLAADEQGTPWILVNGGVYWWDGEQWRQAKADGKPLRSGYYLAGLLGGDSRGLYLSQSGSHQHEGRLYKLQGGKVIPAGDFYYGTSGRRPGLYVSNAGDIFNYSKRYLAIRQGSKWTSVETPLADSPYELCVADFSPTGPVLFVSRKRRIAAIWDGKRFHTQISTHSAPDERENPPLLNACRWGSDRVIMWRQNQDGFVAARLTDNELHMVDSSELTKKLGVRISVRAAWTDAQGNAWLYGWHRINGYGLFCIDGDEEVTKVAHPHIKKYGLAIHHYRPLPQNILSSSDGWQWLGLGSGVILRIRGREEQLLDWRRGAANAAIRLTVETAEGDIYAASAKGDVYQWRPEAKPDDGLTKVWTEITSMGVGMTMPITAPNGSLWTVLESKPTKLSRWDGRNWTHRDVPFDTTKISRLAVDDKGNIIAQMRSYPDGTYLIAAKGVEHFKDPRQAIAACVNRGGRRFTASNFIGPVVDKTGRVWFSYGANLEACFDGEWEQFELGGLVHIALSDDGKTPWLATRAGWWTYRGGRLLRISSGDQTRLRLLGPWGTGLLPYCENLPKSLLPKLLPMVSGDGWRPISHQAAQAIVKGQARPQAQKGLRYPHHAISDGEGGFWVRDNNSAFYRFRRGRMIRLDGRRTPLTERLPSAVGFDTTGRFWIRTDLEGNYHGTYRTFVRTDGGPRLQIKPVVTRGRSVTVKWQGDSTVLAVEHRLGNEPWQITQAPSGSLAHHVTQPGRHKLVLTARAMDSLGHVGKPVYCDVTLDVKLPTIAWHEGRAPLSVGQAFWKAPIEVAWAFDDVPDKRIEYRINGGPWQKLCADRRIFVGHLNGQVVEMEFRAIEEGTFASAKTLSAIIAVEMSQSLAEWISQRVDLALADEGVEGQQAIEELGFVRKDALRVLQERLTEAPSQRQRISAVIGQLNRQKLP